MEGAGKGAEEIRWRVNPCRRNSRAVRGPGSRVGCGVAGETVLWLRFSCRAISRRVTNTMGWGGAGEADGVRRDLVIAGGCVEAGRGLNW